MSAPIDTQALKALADAIIRKDPNYMDYIPDSLGKMTSMLIKAVPKERPRTGKNGGTYTPKRTKDFEAAIGKHWQDEGLGVIYGPVAVHITIGEKYPTEDGDFGNRLQQLNFVFNDKGDIDNMAKSVLDGLNGYAWVDDKQVVSMGVNRVFEYEDRVTIHVQKIGLTPSEAHCVSAYLKAAENAEQKDAD